MMVDIPRVEGAARRNGVSPMALDEDLRLQPTGTRERPLAAAFDSVVRAHQAWLLRYVRYLIGDSPDAEDVTQDAMVKAYLGLGWFRGDSSFRTWLRRIATRLAYNHCRDSGTRRKYERRSLEIEGPTRPEELVASREVLHQVMGQLSGRDREVLRLVHRDSLSLRQTAEVLDIGLSAAKMRHKRARARFIDIYETRTSGEVAGVAPPLEMPAAIIARPRSRGTPLAPCAPRTSPARSPCTARASSR